MRWFESSYPSKTLPAWRNWQTRWTQNPVSARTCRFDPGRRYKLHSIRSVFLYIGVIFMSDKFKLLLKQIHFPQHEEAYNEIKSGSIESVKLFKSKTSVVFLFFLSEIYCHMRLSLFLIICFTLLLIL